MKNLIERLEKLEEAVLSELETKVLGMLLQNGEIEPSAFPASQMKKVRLALKKLHKEKYFEVDIWDDDKIRPTPKGRKALKGTGYGI
jgi:hypothetical protein